MRLIEHSSSTSYYALVGYASVAATYVELWERESSLNCKSYFRETRAVCEALEPPCANIPGGLAQRLVLSGSSAMADRETQGQR